MKKKIKKLLEMKKGSLRINKFCTLYRSQEYFGQPEDRLTLDFSITRVWDYSFTLTSRDPESIITLIESYTIIAFGRVSEQCRKDIQNGYCLGEVLGND